MQSELRFAFKTATKKLINVKKKSKNYLNQFDIPNEIEEWEER